MGKVETMEEHEVALLLATTGDISRDDLEEWAILAEDALTESAADFALGASAVANFAQNAIEIDFLVHANSPSELHERLADVLRVLMEAGFEKLSPATPTQPRPAQPKPTQHGMRLAASSTHAVLTPA
jgi:hypothetical protein